MTLARTDEQKVLQSPITMLFGTQKYSVKPLPLIPAREWRVKFNEVIGPIAENFASKGASIPQTLANALNDFPEKIADLIFAYAPDLPKDQIMREATEEQLVVAYEDLMVVAYPFLVPLVMTMRVVRPTTPSA